MPDFVPGRELNRRFYVDAVRPLLADAYPELPYAAAMLGPGSEVLGFDTAMSMDHDWGLRLLVLLAEPQAHLIAAIERTLRDRLPPAFLGQPVRLAEATSAPAVGQNAPPASSPIGQSVRVLSLRQFVRGQLDLDLDLDAPLTPTDWLTTPAQMLREVTAGAVYHDGSGDLTALRTRLEWYPHDVWLYLLAAGWQRIGQEEHLMPRAGCVGDELGSAILGSRLVRDGMHLGFLMEQCYAPYPKWLGTAFRQLRCAAELEPALWRAQRAATWQEREAALAEVYTALARLHNALGLTEPVPATTSPFYDRPFRVMRGEAFASALAARIADPAVRRIAARGLYGNIDQVSDNTDVRGRGRAALRHLYE